MADRTSAGIFGDIFEFLVTMEQNEHTKKFAKKMWENSYEYDFCPDQMGCDDSLVKLGFAKRGIHPRYKEECMMYLGADGEFE